MPLKTIYIYFEHEEDFPNRNFQFYTLKTIFMSGFPTIIPFKYGANIVKLKVTC